jgi:cobalt-zinc-cadmium resistance protein CzcA
MRFNELIAGVRSDVAVKVYGDDFGRMEGTAREIASVLGRIRGASDVKVEQTDGLPVMNFVADREAAARLGVDMIEVQDLVSAAIGGRAAGVVFEGDRRVDVIVRLDDAGRADREALCDLPLRIESRAGEHVPGDHELAEYAGAGFVPLCTVARIDLSTGPHQVSRYNGKRMITVQANVRGRDLGTFVAEAQQRVNAVALPPGGWLEWGGQFENLAAAKERFAFVVPLCFFLIFLLLFSAFRSVRLALIVFSGVPLGLTGGIVALWLRDIPFSITAAVGFIALSGVAVLNGLVMVSAIDGLRRGGVALDEAITRGSLTRLRPVLMTALVASLGFLPMAIATGTGAEVQRPLATVVIGGLVSSTLLTLVVLPALYRMFERRARTE